MDSPKQRLHLDRVEVIVMFGLFVIVAAMMFTLGVLVGHGLGAREGAGAHLSQATEHALHAESTYAEHHGSSDRRPASEEKTEKSEPGGGLRKAFRESKQQALVEMSLRDDAPTKPKSVLDNGAHLAAHSEWDRKPASEENTEEADKVEVARKAEEDREKAGVPKDVRSLFERKPSSLDRFVPTSGTFTVQIASYATVDEAMAKVAQLRRAGFNDAYSETMKLKGGETWHRVGVGSFPGTQWAGKVGERLVKRKLAHDYVVRRVP